MFKLEAKIMAVILMAPLLLGIIAGLIGPRLFNRPLEMKISCYLKKDEPENNEKFTNAIERIFANYSNVEEITSTTTEESIVVDIRFKSIDEISSTEFIDDKVQKIVGEKLVKFEIDF